MMRRVRDRLCGAGFIHKDVSGDPKHAAMISYRASPVKLLQRMVWEAGRLPTLCAEQRVTADGRRMYEEFFTANAMYNLQVRTSCRGYCVQLPPAGPRA